MKFEFIKKVEGKVFSYGNEVGTGDIVDLPPHFAKKAKNCIKEYRAVEESVPEVVAVRKKPGPKPKVKVGD